MQENSPVILLSDAGPLITLAYADALDTLLLPGWRVEMVDMVAHEVTRNETPTSQKIADWLAEHKLTVLKTSVYERYMQALDRGEAPRKSNLGELAVQEVMTNFALDLPETIGVFLFEDHKIARASFMLPPQCHKISTRSFLQFLEEKQWLTSASDIERKAILAGRAFSQLRFPL